MITSSQCHTGLRVKWVSIHPDMPASRGTIVHTSGNRYTVSWDDEEEPMTYDLNDAGSRIYPLTRMVA